MNAINKVQELLKLPQHLCNMCGKCCRLATFKGGLSYDEIIELIKNPNEDPEQVQGAKDFLTIFIPYDNIEDVKKISPSFVDRVAKKLGKENKASFFYCKFLDNSGKCAIHEDRPHLCRMYPIPHERTIYLEGCGFEEQGIKNWNEIVNIINELQKKLK